MGICQRGLFCRFDHEETISLNNSFNSGGTGSQQNKSYRLDDDYEFDTSEELDFDDVAQADQSCVAVGYPGKKVIKERYHQGVDNSYSNRVENYN